MEITERPPTRLALPGGDLVYISTQRWDLEPWEGDDDPELPKPWSIKGKFSVSESRSCAELAVLHHLRKDGWDGVWVSAFSPPRLVSMWPPSQESRLSVRLAHRRGPWGSSTACEPPTAEGSAGSSTCSPGESPVRSDSTR
jgi:hypothetical protein